jgi:hypothetical protein
MNTLPKHGESNPDCFLWQRCNLHIHPAKEIIFTCYYNRNDTETVLAGKLEETVNDYYPSRTYGNDLYNFRLY